MFKRKRWFLKVYFFYEHYSKQEAQTYVTIYNRVLVHRKQTPCDRFEYITLDQIKNRSAMRTCVAYESIFKVHTTRKISHFKNTLI